MARRRFVGAGELHALGLSIAEIRLLMSFFIDLEMLVCTVSRQAKRVTASWRWRTLLGPGLRKAAPFSDRADSTSGMRIATPPVVWQAIVRLSAKREPGTARTSRPRKRAGLSSGPVRSRPPPPPRAARRLPPRRRPPQRPRRPPHRP